jgi:hypothetical protein
MNTAPLIIHQIYSDFVATLHSLQVENFAPFTPWQLLSECVKNYGAL